MFTKFAAAQVLSAGVAQKGGSLMKDAHRHEFHYDPRPGYLYVRSRAISSRTNDNYDNFPAEEIKKAYKTFIGKPVFVNHHNDDHRRARGVIVDAALHEDTTPQGQPDTWVEVLMEVDAVRFPKLAQAILAGHIDRTSMGTDVAFSVCSVCNNKAETPLEYCQHIPAMKGMRVRRRTASGGTEEVLVYEKCYGLGFFENSLLVEEPADPTAYFLGVDDRGLAMTASRKTAMIHEIRWEPRYDVTIAPGLMGHQLRVECDDCGVIKDGGNYADFFTAQEAAARVVDGHERVKHGTTGSRKTAQAHGKLYAEYYRVYAHGQSATVDSMDDVKKWVKRNGAVTGTVQRVNAYWPLDEQGNERDDLPLVWIDQEEPKRFEVGSRGGFKLSAASTFTCPVCGFESPTTQGLDLHWTLAQEAERMKGGGEHLSHEDAGIDNYQSRVDSGRNPYTGTRKVASKTATPAEYAQGYKAGRDAAKADLQSGGSTDMPDGSTDFMDGWARGYEDVITVMGSKTARNPFKRKHSPTFRYMPRFSDPKVPELEPGQEVALWDDPDHLRATNAQTARVYPLRFLQDLFHPPFDLKETIEVPVSSLVMASKTAGATFENDEHYDYIGNAAYEGEIGEGQSVEAAGRGYEYKGIIERVSPSGNELSIRDGNMIHKVNTGTLDWLKVIGMKNKSSKVGYGETKVPAEVNTLRDENCPICGESDSFDGDRCMVCQYVKPPDEFMDPDLEKAKQVDLRQEQDAMEVGTLKCDNCGTEYDASTEPETVENHKASHKLAKPKPPFIKGEDEDDENEDDDEESPSDSEPLSDEDSEDSDSNPFVESDDEQPQEGNESPESESGQYKAGDICPNCGEGTLQVSQPSAPVEDSQTPIEDGAENEDAQEDGDGEEGEVNPFAKDKDSEGPPSGSEDEDSEESDDSDDEDEEKPHGLKFKKKQSSQQTGGIDMRPALEVLRKQQDTIDAQNKRIAALTEGLRFIAQAAGIEKHPRVVAFLKTAADDENPAQPSGWANPGGSGEEAPVATSDETLGFDNESQEPSLPDDPTEIGDTSETDTSADAQTSLESSDTVLDDGLDLNEVDVTAPVSGTDDLGEGPRGQAGSGRTETEVRIGDPNNPEVAFAETGWTEAKKGPSEVRAFAALRLARLRLRAGIEQGDDIALSAKIAASDLTDEAIQSEISTLDRVVTAQQKNPRPKRRNLVPRAASVDRTVPSFQAPVQKVAVGPDSDEFLFD